MRIVILSEAKHILTNNLFTIIYAPLPSKPTTVKENQLANLFIALLFFRRWMGDTGSQESRLNFCYLIVRACVAVIGMLCVLGMCCER